MGLICKNWMTFDNLKMTCYQEDRKLIHGGRIMIIAPGHSVIRRCCE